MGGELTQWDDELPKLYAEGVRGVVCLLNIPGDPGVYEKAGFSFHLMPVANGSAPTLDQTLGYLHFIDMQVSQHRPVVVHCEAGLGRTGTVVAGYLIAHGELPMKAIENVRKFQPAAIETTRQVNYLLNLPEALAGSAYTNGGLTA